MEEDVFRSAGALCAAIQRGVLSAVEAVRHYLDRIEHLNATINAVVANDPKRALAEAREADRARAHGQSVGPLHGLPMTIKDSFEVVGMPATGGAEELAHYRPRHDALSVKRLREAGAIVIGKTNLPRFGNELQSFNAVYGTTSNPWDFERTCGGSSGGAAAALAAGLTPLELGSDIGGSIRIPAHFCGVSGHKSSYGIIPVQGQLGGRPGARGRSDISVVGPMAREAADLDLALSVLAGPDEHDAHAWRLDLPSPRHKDIRDFRIAAWLDDPVCPIDAEQLFVYRRLMVALRGAGAKVDEKARPDIDFARAHELYYDLVSAVMGGGLPEDVWEGFARQANGGSGGESDYGTRFLRAATQSHRAWLRRDEGRQQLRQRWAEFFREYDVLLCPPAFTAAFPHDHTGDMSTRRLMVNAEWRPYLDLVSWVGLAGAAYLPATVTPVGQIGSGLPVGIQIVGPYLEDRTTIAFAAELERLGYRYRRPPGF